MGFLYLIFIQDENTKLILDNFINTFFTLGLPATLPIYIMVLMFDILMVAVKISSFTSSNEKNFFKKVMFFEIVFLIVIIIAWLPYFISIFE